MKIPRIVFAAPSSGSGKTVTVCALLKALSMQGRKAAAYKCGPDYIDPMFHREELGIETEMCIRDRTEEGYEVRAQIRGLGEMEGIQNLFLEHIEEVM